MLIRSRVRVRLLSGWLVVIRTVFILLSAVAACTAPVYVRGQLTSKLYRKQWLSADAWCGGKDHRHSPEIDTSHTRWSFEPRVSSSLSRAAAARLFYFSATDYSTPNVIFRLFLPLRRHHDCRPCAVFFSLPRDFVVGHQCTQWLKLIHTTGALARWAGWSAGQVGCHVKFWNISNDLPR